MTYPCHGFSEQVGLAGDLRSTNDILIPLIDHSQRRLLLRMRLIVTELVCLGLTALLSSEPTTNLVHCPLVFVNSYDEREVLKELKKLQVNSSESATRLRRLLKEKSRIKEDIKATMNMHCSEIPKDALPPKEKDPGSFTLPCRIHNMCFDKALADLGSSVSIMPYSTFTNLGLVMQNMDAYRDKDMGDVIFGKPFCRDACVEERRFNGFITIHNGNDIVTYQMARSHPSKLEIAMSPASKSKSKDKRVAGREPQKSSTKPTSITNTGGSVPTSGYNTLLGTFHALETKDRIGMGIEYDSLSNSGG
ncbi:hypothetical protein Tco_0844631 [Tanacetum coccineum]